MSKINLVLVPVWLNLIMKELGLSHADLTDYEKLSGILSTRDLLIYRMAQEHAGEILQKLTGEAKLNADFGPALECHLSLEERAFTASMDEQVYLYGATCKAGTPVQSEVRMVDQNTMAISFLPASEGPLDDSVDPGRLPVQMVKVLHGHMSLDCLAKTRLMRAAVKAM